MLPFTIAATPASDAIVAKKREADYTANGVILHATVASNAKERTTRHTSEIMIVG